MKKNESKPNHDNINRRKLLGKLSLFAGAGLLSSELLGTEAELPDREKTEVIQVGSLKQAKNLKNIRHGAILLTFGFYEPGDGGAACYRVISLTQELEINQGDVISLNKDIAAVLINRSAINYKMFGAVGDAKNDDGIQIKLAHAYANKYNLPVENTNGEYWIKKTRNIDVKTSVQWGSSIFHIDERYNTKQPVFNVLSYEKSEEIKLDDAQKKQLLKKLSPGVQAIGFLHQYKNHLIVICDRNDRIGYRSGSRYNNSSWAKEELFYVEEDGRIIGDIAWTFNDYTELLAFPAECCYLMLEGGSFYLSGNPPENKKTGYVKNGFTIARSRTIIRNQWVGLEHGARDVSMNPRSGFYSFSNVYDVTLENIRLTPWEQDREGKAKDVPAGTYGIGGNRMLNTTFRNITAEGTMLHWGVFGTNLNKDFKIESCRLNRVDVHFHCWNLMIKDSHIGNRGISVTGGGELTVENTTVENRFFINLRRDYGAKWDGNISIKNCRLKPNVVSETFIIYSIPADFDYGYPIGTARSVTVENFIIDYKSIPDCKANAWLIALPGFSKSKKGLRSFFPETIQFKNTSVEGREKGVRLMKVTNPQGYHLSRTANYDQILFQSNSYICFSNIQLDKGIGDANDFHLQIESGTGDPYDLYSLYPKIQISNCDSVSIHIGNALLSALIENCTVSRISNSANKPLQGEMTFVNCKFVPVITNKENKPYSLSSELGTTFINCVFHLPRLNQNAVPEMFSLVDFIKVNEFVLHNHLNSRLGRDVLNSLKEKNISLKMNFIQMLRSHHELEEHFL